MKQRTNQSGFGALAIVIVIAVVAVLAVTGVVVYQRHKSTNGKNSAATGQAQTTTQPQDTTSTQTQQTTTQYLTIKEWGVKLPLSDSSIKSAYYVVGTSFSNDPDGLPSGVFLGLTSLSDKSCNPSNNNSGGTGAIGALLRVSPTETDAVSGQPLTQKYPNGTTIGNYYYAYQSWINRTSCTQKSTAQAADSAFATAAKNIVATN